MISGALSIIENEQHRNELERIYEREKGRFCSVAYSRLKNIHETEDAVQNAFLAIAKKPDTLFSIPEGKRVAYICVMVRNAANDILAKKHKHDYVQVDSNYEITDENILFDERIESSLSCAEIYKYIDTLPETTKTAVYLRLNFDLSFSEIADRLGINEVTVRQRVYRAIRKIREHLKEAENE